MATADCKALGRRIRVLRVERRWTQQILADHATLSRESISAIENGRFDPTYSTLRRIAKALEIKLARVFEGLD
ncbi:helix-turn-helix transcriptional regulator [Granulicella sp. WH15]|nr:helix-turn-helix transcriptional regulator [Granulicella sp. WH15]